MLGIAFQNFCCSYRFQDIVKRDCLLDHLLMSVLGDSNPLGGSQQSDFFQNGFKLAAFQCFTCSPTVTLESNPPLDYICASEKSKKACNPAAAQFGCDTGGGWRNS
ncbi:MAG TPA: hypothetical protein VMX16_19065 [Terriglobia bacterium]|nr:hypothetical protein [Terriglobia bacterium]